MCNLRWKKTARINLALRGKGSVGCRLPVLKSKDAPSWRGECKQPLQDKVCNSGSKENTKSINHNDIYTET